MDGAQRLAVGAVVLYLFAGVLCAALGAGPDQPSGVEDCTGLGRSRARVLVEYLRWAGWLLAWPAALARPQAQRVRPQAQRVWSVARAWTTREVAWLVLRYWVKCHGRAKERAIGQPQVPARVPATNALPDTRIRADEAMARFRPAIARVQDACRQERLVDAVFAATALLDQVTLLYGPGHPCTLQAVELLAHVCHLVGDHARGVQLYVHAAVGWSAQGKRSRAVRLVRNAYTLWQLSSDGQALRTGILLLPYLREYAGSDSPTVARAQERLRHLQRERGVSWAR
ncbi:hypothetical protein [Streptacidiphilus sp. MAP12-16]|uniref:hypothetical protein n=1 Tax=Streptacidiphilus sp. MAP12-16 TaxID=3156300 RepID=UPI00351472F9